MSRHNKYWSSPGTCTVTNTVVEGPPPTEILTIIKEIGVCDGSTTTCITIQYLHQTLPLTLLKVQIQLQVHLTSQASPGTAVELEAGAYQVTEAGLDSVTPQTCSDQRI